MTKILSIIIITRNTRELLCGLLESLKKDELLQPMIAEIIIVDNASDDGTEDMVRRDFPFTIYVKNSNNLGFAASANKGFSKSTGEYLLFLNSDTVVIKNEFIKMIEFMEKDTSVGISAPQLVYENMKPQRSFAYYPNLLFEIIPRSLLELLLPHRYLNKNMFFTGPIEVQSLIGAAVLVRRSVFEAQNGFDERFFFFLEETDFCLRVKAAGKKVIFFPETKIIHLQGKTVSKDWTKGRIEYNISLYKFIKKHHSYIYYRVFIVVRFIKSFIFILILTILPFLLIKKRVLRSYGYYLKLFIWHLYGCQDTKGLKN